jgi:glycosyltransferase involved in cell wall biosynthesis
MSVPAFREQGIHVALVSCYPPSTGPLSEYSYHLVKEYRRSSGISRITVMADKVGHEEKKPGGGIELARCWSLNDPLVVFRLVKKSLELRPDVVHFNILLRQFSSNRLFNFLGLTTPAVLRLLRRRVVVTLHSLAEGLDVKEVGYSDSFFNRLGYTIATRLLLTANAVTVTHQHFAGILERRYAAHNVIVVPHGVFFSPKEKLVFSGKRLLLFGKIGPYKNAKLALDAFNRVFFKDHETELIIAGPGHPFHQGLLDTTTRSRDLTGVKFVGYVPEDSLEGLFDSCAIVLLPYTTPTWSSGTFTLASAFGRPVVASDVPDFRELASEGAGVVLFPNGDSEAMADMIEQVLNNPQDQQRLGEANLAWARAHRFVDSAHTLVLLLLSIAMKKENPTRKSCA